MDNQVKVAVVGLGYVGLPLAVEFAKTDLAPVIGFDVNEQKINELERGIESMGEVAEDELKKADIIYTTDPAKLKEANFIIIAVPTPINDAKVPDLTLVRKASETVGNNLSKGSIVVFESTVYPGVTEDICLPIIEKVSSLKCGVDWKIGYSPERVNPGDKEHTIDKIVKIVSGMDQESLMAIAKTYEKVCKAGVYQAPDIKTAEAAKVIENVQRDLNIALVNELALIFQRIGIKTQDVIEAAGTKWNFHKYKPGLVGGHCIGVDPYYLVYKAEELGYHPEIITAGRRINDFMGEYVARLTVEGLIEANKVIKGAKVLILGLTFKENVKDIRNSKVKDIIKNLKKYKINVVASDPMVDEEVINHEFDVENVKDLNSLQELDAVILAVPHRQFAELGQDYFNKVKKDKLVLIDIKSIYKEEDFIKKEDIVYKCL